MELPVSFSSRNTVHGCMLEGEALEASKGSNQIAGSNNLLLIDEL